jgi:hypothetical protein
MVERSLGGAGGSVRVRGVGMFLLGVQYNNNNIIMMLWNREVMQMRRQDGDIFCVSILVRILISQMFRFDFGLERHEELLTFCAASAWQ